MINGQTLSAGAVEENILAGQNADQPVQIKETAAATETDAAEVEAKTPMPDLRAKFARLRKTVRRRSVSIF